MESFHKWMLGFIGICLIFLGYNKYNHPEKPIFQSWFPCIQLIEPTYTKDIRPVMKKHCFMCHNSRMMPYADWTKYNNVFKARYKILSRVWTRRDMPPGGGTITDKERKLISEWVNTGAKK